jgi:hypothetical protein
MLQLDDALDDFKKAQKNINSDKKALAANKDKKAIADDLDKLIKKMDPLVKERTELGTLMKNAKKIKDKLAAYNKEQQAVINQAKSLGVACKAIKPADDTKTKDFASIADDATSLQSLNALEDL